METALVTKNITRDDFGSDKDGFRARAFDRVEILSKGTWSCGTRWYAVRAESGETFRTTEHEVQEDAR